MERKKASDFHPEVLKLFDGYVHGALRFHNDTTPRYDEAAAQLSWQRTVDFFAKNVRG